MSLFPSEGDFIDIHSHHAVQEENVFRICNQFSAGFNQPPAGPVSVGLHPWHLDKTAVDALPAVLAKAGSYENVLAFGETGLDKVIKTPIEEQEVVFRIHIEAAIRAGKPLVIHCVRAINEMLALRKEYTGATPWILHGFNSGPELAIDCIKAGIYISFSQRLFRNPVKAKEIASVVPLSLAFAETDDDPMNIREVYHSMAGYYGLDTDELRLKILGNFTRVFTVKSL